jgi:hypothetical protein
MTVRDVPEVFDLRVLNALARIALEARRCGADFAIRDPPAALCDLLVLAGLDGALGLEPQRQPKEREKRRGVEEERELGDTVA